MPPIALHPNVPGTCPPEPYTVRLTEPLRPQAFWIKITRSRKHPEGPAPAPILHRAPIVTITSCARPAQQLTLVGIVLTKWLPRPSMGPAQLVYRQTVPAPLHLQRQDIQDIPQQQLLAVQIIGAIPAPALFHPYVL